MRGIFILFIAILSIVLVLGCSKGAPSPIAPLIEPTLTPDNRSVEGHVLWGAWEISIDQATLEITVEPMRAAENHFDVTKFVTPPTCTDCVKLKMLDVDFPKHLFNVEVLLKNPTALKGYDVRGIVLVKPGQECVNADNYTELWDVPGNETRNPFVAFAKETTQRAFDGGSTHAAVYRLILPPSAGKVIYVVDASHPGNCPEPYQIDVLQGIDYLDDAGAVTETIRAEVYDWQNDITAVRLDLSALGAASPIDLLYKSGIWSAGVTNTYGAAAGFYTCWLEAYSSSGPKIFQPVEIEIKASGTDRLPTVLDLMHVWDVSGNPSLPLTKQLMNYFKDSKWIPPDTPFESSRLPYYNQNHIYPLQAPPFYTDLPDQIETVTDPPNLYDLLNIGADQLGEKFLPVTFEYQPTPSMIADAMEVLYTAIGSTLSPSDKQSISDATSGLPYDIQFITAAVLKATATGYPYRQTAISGYTQDEVNMLFDYGKGALNSEDFYVLVAQESSAFDYPNMYRAGATIFQALDQVRSKALYYTPKASSGWEWNTPIGKVKIGSSNNDSYAKGDYLLILDPGGNDTYNCSAGANTSLANGFSVCIDLDGDDTYNDQDAAVAQPNPGQNFAQGAGRMGIGILWDVYGDDKYDNYRFCQGFANFGLGCLMDSGGNDQYNNDSLGQGSGYYGMGILIDEWGNDKYDTYEFSQGFAYIKGWGLAYDHEGDDTWTANDPNIVYPSAQTTDHNLSMSQGMGFGLRIDGSSPPNDSVWMSGGQGILFDHAGNDTYSCGVFGQASAYWFGTGILADYGGIDSMRGIWYVQSGAAHYGTSLLISNGNDNDTYRVSTNVCMGGGHDFSNSFFLEEGGDDWYTNIPEVSSGFPGIALGAGNDNGTGFFIDYAGNDTYDNPNANTIGHGNYFDGRKRGSWGVFIDLGGSDKYAPEKSAEGVANSQTWSLGDVGGGGDFYAGIVNWQ